VTGDSATLSDWRQYAVCLAGGALIVWIIIHLLTLTGIMLSVSAPVGAVSFGDR